MNKEIEVTDIKKILTEKSFYSESMRAYGVPYHLKKFAGIDRPLNKCSIEHGLVTGRCVCQCEMDHHVPYVLTFSPFREEVIRELTDIVPIAIGPYIAYAQNYRSKEYTEKMKKKIGRTLLVMPSHSISEMRVEYNVKYFIQQIETARKYFDTVMVSMHFMDLRMGLWKPYKKKGYQIVSSGNTVSPCFLSRLKYIMCLSDAVMVNDVTTGMAYAMYMNRPIRLIRQQIKFDMSGNNNACELEIENYYEQIRDLFDQREFIITKDQREFGKYMFGLDNVKSKREMGELLLSLSRTTA